MSAAIVWVEIPVLDMPAPSPFTTRFSSCRLKPTTTASASPPCSG